MRTISPMMRLTIPGDCLQYVRYRIIIIWRLSRNPKKREAYLLLFPVCLKLLWLDPTEDGTAPALPLLLLVVDNDPGLLDERLGVADDDVGSLDVTGLLPVLSLTKTSASSIVRNFLNAAPVNPIVIIC